MVDAMVVVILTTIPLSITGGAQKFIRDIASACNGVIINPFRQRIPEDTEFIIYMDELSSLFRLVYKKQYMRYFFTPRRAFYDMYYFAPIHHRILAILLRPLDRWFVKLFIDNIVCISHTVRNRINKVYQKDARVIYSPVHPEEYTGERANNGFWLVVSRVDKWKRIGLILDTFRDINERLVIAGPIYKKYSWVDDIIHPNIIIYGEVPEWYLKQLYLSCKGVICMSVDEDLGLVPLEAHACGKQVIAVKEGGYLETGCDILIPPTKKALIDAISNFKYNSKEYDLTEFTYDTFKRKLNEAIEEFS